MWRSGDTYVREMYIYNVNTSSIIIGIPSGKMRKKVEASFREDIRGRLSVLIHVYVMNIRSRSCTETSSRISGILLLMDKYISNKHFSRQVLRAEDGICDYEVRDIDELGSVWRVRFMEVIV